MTGNPIASNPDMLHFDDLVDWVYKHRPDLLTKFSATGVANIMLDGLDFALDAIRHRENKLNWDLTSSAEKTNRGE